MFGKRKESKVQSKGISQRRTKSNPVIEETTFVNSKEIQAQLDNKKNKKQKTGLFGKSKKSRYEDRTADEVVSTPIETNHQMQSQSVRNKKDEPYSFLSKVGIDLYAQEDKGTREYTLWFIDLLKEKVFPAITNTDTATMQLELTDMVIHEALEKNRTSLPDDLVQDEDVVQVGSVARNPKGQHTSNRRKVEVNMV